MVSAVLKVCVNEVINEVELEGILFTNITGNEVTLSAGETFTVEYQLLPEDVDQTLTIEWIKYYFFFNIFYTLFSII